MHDGIEAVIADVEELLRGLFTSGLAHAPAARAVELERLSERCQTWGLTLAATTLGQMAAELELRRHRTRHEDGEYVRLFFLLHAYLQAIREKIEWAQAERSLG